MPRSAASPGLISTNISCCNSASHRFERVSSPPPSYSTSRPEVRINGKSFAMPFSIAACCTLKPIFGSRNCLARSEEHTSELQSLMRISYAVFCLKKKHRTQKTQVIPPQVQNHLKNTKTKYRHTREATQ